MSAITAQTVNDLRQRTGAGLMDCKKALTEANGDMEKAVEILRIKGVATRNKKADRKASEGILAVQVSADGRAATLLELNCETDFVAKNEDFLAFAAEMAKLAVESSPADAAALVALPGVEGKRQGLVQKIGENITVRRLERIQGQGRVAQYVHGGRIGVIVAYNGGEDAGRDMAMHISFSRPAFLSKDQVPADVVQRERDILSARAKESGKPEAIVAKMVEGGLNKFAGEMTLLGQPFVKDDKQTVEKMLGAKKAKVHAFRFLVVGEGIEKKSNDFAAEVAAMRSEEHTSELQSH